MLAKQYASVANAADEYLAKAILRLATYITCVVEGGPDKTGTELHVYLVREVEKKIPELIKGLQRLCDERTVLMGEMRNKFGSEDSVVKRLQLEIDYLAFEVDRFSKMLLIIEMALKGEFGDLV